MSASLEPPFKEVPFAPLKIHLMSEVVVVLLPWQDKEVKVLVGIDKRLHQSLRVYGMYVLVHVARDEHQVTF